MAAEHVKKVFSSFILPVSILIIILSILVWIGMSLPSQDHIMRVVQELYHQFGYLIVFCAGMVEATFLVGMYLPGSTAVLLGAVMARLGSVSLPFIILFGTGGMLLGYSLNYVLGRYGWYHVLLRFGMEQPLKKAEQKLATYGSKVFLVGYLAPNGGAFLSTAAGIGKMPYQKFIALSLLSQLLWSTLWGVLAYLFGAAFIEVFFTYTAVIIYLIFGTWLLRLFVRKKWGRKTGE